MNKPIALQCKDCVRDFSEFRLDINRDNFEHKQHPQSRWKSRILSGWRFNRNFQLVVFISGQKMALRAFYFLRTLTKALIYDYINHSQRHLLVLCSTNDFQYYEHCCVNFWTDVLSQKVIANKNYLRKFSRQIELTWSVIRNFPK